MKRKIYLNMQPLAEAYALFTDKFANHTTASETIPSHEASGRVTACPVTARLSAPSFHAAAMDGIAVQAATTFGASDDSPVSLDIGGKQALFINTGQPLPDSYDAVIMIEHILLAEDQQTGIIRAPVYPWQNVRKVGEDIVATELLFPSNHLITPPDVAALLTAGCPDVKVRKKPQITIIPTGSELVDIRTTAIVPPGRTIESNSAVLAALAVNAGAEVTVTPIIADADDTLTTNVMDAVRSDADVVVINAGSSAGSADYTVKIIEKLGEVLVHGVTIMPGKPTILGMIDNKPVIGSPGYPVSAIISFEQFVVPLLEAMQGLSTTQPAIARAILARDIPSRGGIEEFRRMITGKIGSNLVTLPLKKGAGAITTLTRANSILRIAASSEGETRGSKVNLELLRPQSQIENTLLCTGSHDLCLDILHDLLKKNSPYTLASTHVGSLGGILAVRDTMTHIAGSHLLDPASGEYNTPYITRYLQQKNIALITLVHREQGFIVLPGNPENIQTISDLAREDICFINRQSGSGTRVLLDNELDKAGLDPDDISGYDQEEYTHMAVAVAVLSGKVSTGLGIRAAANALNLDFVPLTEERYDLIIPAEYLELASIQTVLSLITSSQFSKAVAEKGGYSTRETGIRVL